MQEIETLRASGKTQEEIDAIVPKKYSEMVEEKQNRAKTVEDMQKDIAFLLKEVKELRQISQVQGINENGNETIEKTSSTSTSRQLVENAKEVTTKTVTDAPWEKDIASLRHEVQELRQIIQGKSTRRQHFVNNQKEETQTAPWDSDSGILGMHTGGSTSIVDAVLNE
jgi:predicted  nucleic acid-binding Zn-ribbon protein